MDVAQTHPPEEVKQQADQVPSIATDMLLQNILVFPVLNVPLTETPVRYSIQSRILYIFFFLMNGAKFFILYTMWYGVVIFCFKGAMRLIDDIQQDFLHDGTFGFVRLLFLISCVLVLLYTTGVMLRGMLAVSEFIYQMVVRCARYFIAWPILVCFATMYCVGISMPLIPLLTMLIVLAWKTLQILATLIVLVWKSLRFWGRHFLRVCCKRS
jgi:hypothetical protein